LLHALLKIAMLQAQNNDAGATFFSISSCIMSHSGFNVV
jgi:hypothetical protein